MGVIIEHNKEIEELSNRLGSLVKRAYRELTKETAEEIANDLIEEKGLDDVCRDIYKAIEEVEDLIDKEADSLRGDIVDDYLLATFIPPLPVTFATYSEYDEVDEEDVDYYIPSPFSVDSVIMNYALELWRVGIRRELEKILKEKCKRAGLLRRVLAKVRG